MKTTAKKIITLFLTVLMLFSVASMSACLFIDTTGRSISRYEYVNNEGEISYFEINFDDNTYVYEGNGFYSESMGYMLRPGTAYKVEGSVYYVKSVNNEKHYSFYHHPWDSECYAVLSEDGYTLKYSGIAGMPYTFEKV